MTHPHILIVDDDTAMLRALPETIHLRMADVWVDTCDSAPAALERIAATDYDAIVSDIKMPGMDGLALLERIHTLRPETPTLLITGHGEHDLAVRALRGGAYDFIAKPIDRDYFIASLTRAIQVRALTVKVEEQHRALARHAVELEETVAERTRELRAANAAKDALLHEQQEAHAQVERLARELGRKAVELDTIIEAMADGVFVYDAHARLVRVNERGASLTGFTLDQMALPVEEPDEQNAPQRLDGSPLALEDYPVYQALQGKTFANERYIIHRPGTGEEIVLQHSGAPIRNTDGVITGAVLVAGDVTALYQLERQKDEFLSIASHELKTPLTSLKGLAQIMHRRLERAGSPETMHLAGMERAIGRMEMLVNDLLDISRFESGKLALRMEPTDLVALCRQVVEEQRAATERTIVLELPSAPIELEADVDRIGQVLSNLLSNALKYSPPAEPVALSARADDGEAVFSVADRGPGIAAAEVPHIFERFYRAPSVAVQAGSGVGLGLGLYICSEIVERHGGRIWAESTPGKGSVFTVALPRVPTSKLAGGSSNGRYSTARAPVAEGTAPA